MILKRPTITRRKKILWWIDTTYPYVHKRSPREVIVDKIVEQTGVPRKYLGLGSPTSREAMESLGLAPEEKE